MTEIAVRALSPGTNDPKTAVNCVQSLTSCLSIMMRHQPPSPYHFHITTQDQKANTDTLKTMVQEQRSATLALITHMPTIADFIDMSLGEIRRYAATDLMVLKALGQAMVNLNYACVNHAQQQTLLHELNLIERAGEENLDYQELVDDLVNLCQQAKQFIVDDNAQHQHFNYDSEFATHIRQMLQSTSTQ
jgi:uncharacterized membrane protein